MSLACLLSGPRPAEANTSETEPGECHALISKGIIRPLILVPSSVYNHHDLALNKKNTYMMQYFPFRSAFLCLFAQHLPNPVD